MLAVGGHDVLISSAVHVSAGNKLLLKIHVVHCCLALLLLCREE